MIWTAYFYRFILFIFIFFLPHSGINSLSSCYFVLFAKLLYYSFLLFFYSLRSTICMNFGSWSSALSTDSLFQSSNSPCFFFCFYLIHMKNLNNSQMSMKMRFSDWLQFLVYRFFMWMAGVWLTIQIFTDRNLYSYS